jgi:hypothetical protein
MEQFTDEEGEAEADPRLPNPIIKLFTGDEMSTAIMCIDTINVSSGDRLLRLNADSSSGQIGAFLNVDFPKTGLEPSFDYDSLTPWFTSLNGEYEEFLSRLKAAASAAEVYKLLPDATINLKVLN